MATADEIRDGQRATWAGLSAGWEKWDSVIMDQLGPVGAAMIKHAWVLVPAQVYVARMLETLLEFPPRQEPASFNIASVMEKLQVGIASS